ncbi:MAG: AtpZ/AtpI family protein [Thermoguttaceae bacterium]|nr:AtpZ/AtpI family protein [Thermoguttaceae bacterium]
MSNSNGDFSSLAVGYAAVVRISTVSAQAALCAALGYFVDRRFETTPWGAIVGALLGAAAFGVGLVAAVKRLERDGATVSNASEDVRNRDNVDVDAEISAESLKTETLRGEFEETLTRATAFLAEKSERSKPLDAFERPETPEQAEISPNVGEAERRR